MMVEGAVEVPKSPVEATTLNLGMICSELVEVAAAVAPMLNLGMERSLREEVAPKLTFPGTACSLEAEEECMRMFRKA